MNTYHFTIVIRDNQLDEIEDKLFEAGCDDALLCYYNDVPYLEFDREADNAEQAIKTAIQDIHLAGFYDLAVQESGFSTLAEMANKIGVSRMTMTNYAKNKRGKTDFPKPMYGITSASALYRWQDVANWLYKEGKLAKADYDVAQVAVAF
ncbi:helix-turn-helix transcriptional regulator [Faucicola mancuniensis]|uniref:helix-turn-helix transcriptional regulator n=1 Tax=Faucicola mancuniensis TaxID=1309795 RepID=UPI0039773851